MGYDGANGEQHFRESIENTLKQENRYERYEGNYSSPHPITVKASLGETRDTWMAP